MTALAPRTEGLARGLLALEAGAGGDFAPALATLLGADHLLLFGPSGRRELAWAREGGAGEEASLAPRVVADLLSRPAGVFLHTADQEGWTWGAAFPRARWCLGAVGTSGSVGVLCAGAGEPPVACADDPVLGEALVRRCERHLPAENPWPRLASEALARLSHEFKTPLVTIKGYAELILDQDAEPLSPKVQEWLRRIAAAANRLTSVYRRAAGEERAEAAWAYEARAVSPAEWTRRAVQEAESLAVGRSLRWLCRVEEGLEPVALDPEAGSGALLELLQNAARSTPDGGSVVVTARGETRGGRPGVRVTVADTGVGIPFGAQANLLFQRFVTLGAPLEHASGEFEFGTEGLGLGLPMVRGVARAHGGEAWAEGCGRDPVALPGATFHLWLPAWEGRSDGTPDAGSRGRLLVADPDPEAVRILTEALGEAYEVISVGTAGEALAAWGSGNSWHACVVEPRLAEDGDTVAFLGALRAQGPRTGVILAYTTAGPGEAAAWRAAGADGCLPKPSRARVLLQRLESLRARRTRG